MHSFRPDPASVKLLRVLTQMKTATATKTSPNKRFNVHVRYKSWYISLASSTKQHSEMTNFQVF